MQTLQLSKPVVFIEPQARKTCTAERSKAKILGSKFKTYLKPPHLHHTCNIWQHICFVRKSVRTFSSDVEHTGPGALITVAARKLLVSSALFLPSPFWPNVEPSPPRPNSANGMQMGKLAKPMQPLSKKNVTTVTLLTSSHFQALALSSTSFPFCFLVFEGAGGSNS